MSPTIEQVIERIPEWRGRRVAAKTLSGGRTNAIYRVEVDGASFVVRVPGESTELLAVDRVNEAHNTRAAAEARVGPRVAHFLPDINVMVLEFVEGRTMSIASLQAPGMPTRMAEALKKLHAGPRFLHDFNMFRLVEFYLKIVAERGVAIPADYRDHLPAVARIEAAFARHPLPTVPCHNDMLAENYIDDGAKLWLIDFEYSGNNDPTFELGNTCQEQHFDHARVVEMCSAYFGAPHPDKIARMQLNMILSDVGWTLWSAIQAKISTIDFDFAGWVTERWARAKAKLSAPEFEAWLAAV
jgi:thiamine kinase-like enzyme